jgi:hypothetical protein
VAGAATVLPLGLVTVLAVAAALLVTTRLVTRPPAEVTVAAAELELSH